MKRKKPINLDLMRTIEPLTDNQEELFRCYKLEQNLVAYGVQVLVKHLSLFIMH
jgi:hypothetical protein